MTLRKIPEIKAFDRPDWFESSIAPDALSKWNAGLHAADGSGNATISIYDVIGADPWSGGGVTAKRIDAALRSIGDRPVTVDINSPGGDLFEGMAIYNQLRAHGHKVTVRVMGIAASAASIIAMAGDEILIARAGFMMIHNAWVSAMGNRADLREVADWLEPFDATMADVYVARTGQDVKAITRAMDAETWMGGAQAIDLGYADDYLPADQVKDDPAARAGAEQTFALRKVDSLLARQGIPRNERRSLIAGVKAGTQDAAGNATQDAGDLTAADIQRLIATLKS